MFSVVQRLDVSDFATARLERCAATVCLTKGDEEREERDRVGRVEPRSRVVVVLFRRVVHGCIGCIPGLRKLGLYT